MLSNVFTVQQSESAIHICISALSGLPSHLGHEVTSFIFDQTQRTLDQEYEDTDSRPAIIIKELSVLGEVLKLFTFVSLLKN